MMGWLHVCGPLVQHAAQQACGYASLAIWRIDTAGTVASLSCGVGQESVA